MTVSGVLDDMLALYAKPGTWCHYSTAQDATGREVPADSNAAVAWSLEDALERVIGDWEGNNRRTALLLGASEACGVDLAEFNGTVRRREVVVAVLQQGSSCI